MNGSPATTRGAAGGGREGRSEPAAVAPLATDVPATPASEPILAVEDSS